MKRWITVAAVFAVACWFAVPAMAAPSKAKIGAKDAKALYDALQKMRLNGDPFDFLKAPKKGSGGKDGATVRPLWTLIRSSDGSWTFTAKASVDLKAMKKKLTREKSISVTYNSRAGTLTASGSLEFNKGIQWLVWAVPPITLGIDAGLGADASGTNANGGSMSVTPYLRFTGKGGVGIPYLNAGLSLDVKGYLKFALKGTAPYLARAVGAEVTLSLTVTVVVVVWQQDLRNWRSERSF